MGNIIVIGIIVLIAFFAIRGSVKHFKGEGGCCGGGGSLKSEKKKLNNVIAKKIITIEGMHCENCKNSVERRLNNLEGVAAEVKLKKKIAIVSLEEMISDEKLTEEIERLDFKVTNIKLEEV